MTFSELGSIGEFVASIGVLITLAYLAFQIRQNTQGMRMSQSQEFIRWNTDLVESVVGDRDLAQLWEKGGNQFESLDHTDQLRLTLFEWRAISAWQHYYHMRQLGLVPDHLWTQLLGLFKRIGERESMRQAWRDWREIYDEDFRNFMNGYLDSN